MSGTPLVLPEPGCTREYFGDDARYVKPGDYPSDTPGGAAIAQTKDEAGRWRSVFGAIFPGRRRPARHEKLIGR